MKHINRIGIVFPTIALALASSCLQSADAETQQPKLQKGVVGIQLRERGAFLIETFNSDTVDEEKWRIWHSDPEAVEFSVQDGRFEIRGEGHVEHNGLWSLNPVRFKNVTLVGRMNVQSKGGKARQLDNEHRLVPKCPYLPKGRLPPDTGSSRNARWVANLH